MTMAKTETEEERLRRINATLIAALEKVKTWCEVNNRRGSMLYDIALKAIKEAKR